MQVQQADSKKIILNYGLLLGILMVVLGVIMYVTNSHFEPHWAFLVASFAIFIAIVVYGIKSFKSENGGFLSLSEAIKTAVGISLISGIIAGIWVVLLSTYIEPDFTTQMMEVQRETMLERFPEMSEEQIEKSLEMGARFSSPWITFGFTIIRDLFFGLLVGLIVGAILKRKRPYEV